MRVADLLGEVGAAQAALAGAPAGLAWHAACVRLFLTLSDLLQGVADAQRRGHDEVSPAQNGLGAALVDVAKAIDRSWRSGLEEQEAPALSLPVLDGEAVLIVRRCEGYAFYAVYPELYLRAARALPPAPVVIGLRSIGGGLAALAAAIAGARDLVTLRPQGEPFRRRIEAGRALSTRIRDASGADFVIVDEGPGLSGSSFGGTADWLEDQGVAAGRIHFMPSHEGDLGPEARPEHRERWRSRPRHVADFTAEIVDGPVPLATWFEDLTGAATAKLRDLSGGGWRAVSPWPDAPCDPGREMRKFLLEAERGRFLIKFAGLDAASDAKFARARALSGAGLSPEPLALRHGFLLERWMEGRRPGAAPRAFLEPYLRFRAEAFPAERAGASLATLVEMARHNAREALGSAAERIFARWTRAALAPLEHEVRPVFVDGRLHPWEWIEAGRRILKADAVDHAQAHDLVGCQDIAWDVAGAVAEFSLPVQDTDRMTASLLPGKEELLACLLPCYLGFQLGWWSYAGEAGAKRRDHYLSMLDRLAAG